jgi:hypothetical protein
MRTCAPSRCSCSAKTAEPSTEPLFVFKLTLPNDDYLETERSQRGFFAGVTCPVRTNLFIPPTTVGFRKPSKEARFMSVPKATVNEKAPPLSFVGDVGTTGQIGRTDPIPRAASAQKSSNRHFRGRIPLSYSLHSGCCFGRNSFAGAC